MYIDGYEYPNVSRRDARKLARRIADLFGFYDLRMLLSFFMAGGDVDERWVSAIHRVVWEDGYRFYYHGRLRREHTRPKYLSYVAQYMVCDGLSHLGDAQDRAATRGHRRAAKYIERAIQEGYQYLDGILVLDEAINRPLA